MLSQPIFLLLTLVDAPADRIPVILFAIDGFSATQRTFMTLSGQCTFASCKGDFVEVPSPLWDPVLRKSRGSIASVSETRGKIDVAMTSTTCSAAFSFGRVSTLVSPRVYFVELCLLCDLITLSYENIKPSGALGSCLALIETA